MKYHTTKDGKKIKLSDLETNHLENIIKWIERKAKEGFTVKMGGGTCAVDIWYDEETYYGEEAKKRLNYSKYKNELEKRNKSIKGQTYAKDYQKHQNSIPKLETKIRRIQTPQRV